MPRRDYEPSNPKAIHRLHSRSFLFHIWDPMEPMAILAKRNDKAR